MQVGDKVVCIESAPSGATKKGIEYIVSCDPFTCADGHVVFDLVGVCGLYQRVIRFAPIETQRFTNALTKKLSNDFKEYDQIEIETPKEITI